MESISELLQNLKELPEEHNPTILEGGKMKMCTTTREKSIIQFQRKKKI